MRSDVTQRVRAALKAVLPEGVPVEVLGHERETGSRRARFAVRIANEAVDVIWLDRGLPSSLPEQPPEHPNIILSTPHMSSGARGRARQLGYGWLDETGQASLAVGPIVVVREGLSTGPPLAVPEEPQHRRWAPAVFGTVEALLTGTSATVSATAQATGLSEATTTKTLRLLADLALLDARAERGPLSGRTVTDPNRLLDAYAGRARGVRPAFETAVALEPRAAIARIAAAGARWSEADTDWAVTGALAAQLLAPLLTRPAPLMVYVDAPGRLLLAEAVWFADLQPASGGRLLLRPFPTSATAKLGRQVPTDDGAKRQPNMSVTC